MVHDFVVALFAMTAGFTTSGIAANIYRLSGKRPETLHARAGYLAIMAIAGPSVLFDNAARSWRVKSCSAMAFWLAAAIAGYWSFALGLLVIQVCLAV